MERGVIMNITEEIIVWLVILGIITFLLGTQIGRIYEKKEMNKIIVMHNLISNIWRNLLLLRTKEYTSLLREYIKLTKGTKE